MFKYLSNNNAEVFYNFPIIIRVRQMKDLLEESGYLYVCEGGVTQFS